MERYKQNLRVEGNKVISYTTHVATIQGSKLLVHGYWSATTSKHINYVANEYGLTKVDAPRDTEKESESEASSMFKSTALVALMGNFFCDTQKEKNDWKARMLKAGLSNRGLEMPEDWDQLSEDEKERRLNGVIAIAKEV